LGVILGAGEELGGGCKAMKIRAAKRVLLAGNLKGSALR